MIFAAKKKIIARNSQNVARYHFYPLGTHAIMRC